MKNYLSQYFCQNFENKKQYKIGDIRRYCKHLLVEYKNSIGLVGLSELHRAIFESGYTILHNFKEFTFEKISFPVVINFDSTSEWWNIFVPNNEQIYTRYGYSISENRFSYDKKPIGIVPELRSILNEIKKEVVKNDPKPKLIQSKIAKSKQ